MWCNNVERGCGWEGTVGTLEDHVTKCGFILVPCPNGCKGEDEMTLQLLKKNWESHLECCPEREHQCLDCGLKDAYRVIVGPHDMECTKKMVVCPKRGMLRVSGARHGPGARAIVLRLYRVELQVRQHRLQGTSGAQGFGTSRERHGASFQDGSG